ncbi:MAG: putative sigma-54 modulation protein [Thermoleophilaceae bacterium]|jgi:putative sigma-54 modulation protein|nr:putative sigma-54 modulation protein [Thermoleophilaceae bacterium]MEA2388129.1 putative sigma-54 modulation protein [Thermoleophilaceae bacterium]
MRIEVKGRNFPVDDEVRQRAEKRFDKIGKQVADMAQLELELSEERNPSIPDRFVAEATLHLKGVTLRAHDRSVDMAHSIHLVADELTRQVKRHRDKRRGRRTAPAKAAPPPAAPEAI